MNLDLTATEDFQSRAEKVIRGYIGTMVLLDDQWPERIALVQSSEDEVPVGVDDLDDIPPPDEGDITYAKAPDPELMTRQQDDVSLLDIERKAIGEGIAFSGLHYTVDLKKSALRLAERADILVLDWNLLGKDEGAEALEILEHLAKSTGGPRFVYIFTGQSDATEIHEQVVQRFTAIKPEWSERADTIDARDFQVGPLLFAIRDKGASDAAQAETAQSVECTALVSDAISALIRAFGGFLSLGMLELTVRHRQQLSTMMDRFGPDLDLAVLAEWLDADSPVDLGMGFREILLDEWRAALDEACEHQSFLVMSPSGARAFCAARSEGLETRLPKEPADFDRSASKWTGIHKGYARRLRKLARHLTSCFQTANTNPEGTGEDALFKAMVADPEGFAAKLKPWMKDPEHTAPPYSGQKRKVIPALLRFFLFEADAQNADILTAMMHLQVFYAQQRRLPCCISQGTVVRLAEPITEPTVGEKTIRTTHLVCITPACDAARPGQDIHHLFSFLRADQRDLKTAKPAKASFEQGRIILVQDPSRDDGDPAQFAALRLLPKPPVALHIPAPTFNGAGTVQASAWPVIDRPDTHDLSLELVAQLRKDHALLVASTALGEAGRIGVDIVEYIRTFVR